MQKITEHYIWNMTVLWMFMTVLQMSAIYTPLSRIWKQFARYVFVVCKASL